MNENSYGDRDFARFYEWYVGRHNEDLPFFLEAASGYDGPILELACGTGRITVPISRAGHTITGIDLSRAMLDICRAKLVDELHDVRERVALVQADMRNFDLECSFGLILLPLSSIFHLHTATDRSACLAAIADHLAPGGTAIIDVNSASFMADQEVGPSRMIEESVNPATGKLTREFNRKLDLDPNACRVTIEHSYVEVNTDGTEERFGYVQSYTWLAPSDVDPLLGGAGFTDIDILGDYAGTPFSDTSDRMILIAKKA